MRFILFSAVIYFICLGSQSFAQLIQIPETIKQDTFMLSTGVNYFSTNANYSGGGGSYKDLPSSGRYDNIRLDALGRYDYSNKLSLKGGFGFARATSHTDQIDRTNTGVTDVYFGAQYHYIKSPTWNLFPDVWFGYPLFRVGNSTGPLLGEGAMYLQAGAWLMRRFGRFEPYVYLAYRYQDEGRAGLIPFNLGTRYKVEYMWLGLELGGFQRLSGDSQTAAQKALITDRYDGGSLRYYSTNPSLFEARAYAEGWLSQDMHLKVGVAQTVNGSSTAAGWSAFAVFSLDLSAFSEVSTSNDDRTPYSPARKFRTEERDDTESYFQEKMEVPADGEPPAPRPRPKKRKANLEQMIHDTEKSLEP